MCSAKRFLHAVICSAGLVLIARADAEESSRIRLFSSPAEQGSSLVAKEIPPFAKAIPAPRIAARQDFAVQLTSFEMSTEQPPAPPEEASEPIAALTPKQEVPPAPKFPRVGSATPMITQPFIEPQVTNQTRQALGFYGGYSARATLSQLPRRTPIRPSASQPMHRSSKPFESIQSGPTISPYLNLYREEGEAEGAPNYYAFVRPQMEQVEANRQAQREIQHLRGQVQSMPSTAVGPRYYSAGRPGANAPARYMDTAQFYGGWQR